MHGSAASRTVEDEAFELLLQVGLHLEEFLSQHLRLEGDGVGAVESGGDRLVDDSVGLGRLLANGS
jgi:hypothetical protein